MPVPECIPLAQADDRCSASGTAARGRPRGRPGPPAQPRPSRWSGSCIMPKESINQVRRPIGGHRGDPSVGQQAQPRAAMRTGELGAPSPAREPPRCGKALHGIGRLRDERFGLNASRLLGCGGFADQLGQAARRAQPHLQRIARVGARVSHAGKMVARGMFAQVEHQLTGSPGARATGRYYPPMASSRPNARPVLRPACLRVTGSPRQPSGTPSHPRTERLFVRRDTAWRCGIGEP